MVIGRADSVDGRASALRSRILSFRPSENQLFVVLTLTIGLVAGLSAVGLHELIRWLTEDVFGRLSEELDELGDLAVVVPLVLGALIVGPLVALVATEAKGHGVPEVIEAVAVRGGRIRPRVAWVKAAASAITIGSGGSAGREGPIVQIGASFGSMIVRPFRMSDRRRKTFVAAGAAAGIAAIFNAPLAGVFFALEVILRSFTPRGFSTVVVAAVVSNAVWRVLVGSDPVLDAEAYKLNEPIELVFYGALGIAAAVVALAFVKTLYVVEDWFESSTVPPVLRPALGAVGVGLIGVASIDLLGPGLTGINEALAGEFTTRALLLLIIGKILATSLTLGSGASGGVFSPSLFMGSMLGAAFGDLVTELFPTTSAPAGAYAVVGMAAVFAAAAQAPMSSIFIVFEMTNDFGLIMPLMLACAASAVVYHALDRESIYTEKIKRKHISIDPELDKSLMNVVPLVRAAEAKYVATHPSRAISDGLQMMDAGREDLLLLITSDRALRGVVHRAAAEGAGDPTDPLSSIIDKSQPIGRPDHFLEDGMEMLEDSGQELLPVVDWNDRVLGVATRHAIVRAYEAALPEADDF